MEGWQRVVPSGWWALAGVPAMVWLVAGPPAGPGIWPRTGPVTLSLVGTTDLHGQIFPSRDHGGLALLGGYLENLRAARAADGGAVLLFDSGDTWLDGIESNLSEGAIVVDAYNALGYGAAAVGNHDFEFGPEDRHRFEPAADRRGALKARAAQARFPFLAANLLEDGEPVDWPNVKPSTLVEAAGLSVGVVGVMTRDALSMTLAANVTGLQTTPLTPAIEREATRLRAAGASLVVVAAHAGGYCQSLDDPTNLESCDGTAEIFDVARGLPEGLVDVIFAGHTHAAIAHTVNGIAIVQAHARGRAFSRVDVTLERPRAFSGTATARTTGVRIFPPQELCTREQADGTCAIGDAGAPPRYEGRTVTPDPRVDEAMAAALARVRALQATSLAAYLETPLSRGQGLDESPLANLFADAMRAARPDTDAAIGQASGPGGLRRDLPAGPASFGALYDTFPFDNLVVRRTVTGAELRRLLTTVLRQPRWGGRALGLSGLRARLDCGGDGYAVRVTRATGDAIADDERLVVAMSDFLAARTRVLAPHTAAPHAGEPAVQLVDAVADFLTRRGGRLTAVQFADPSQPRWGRGAGVVAGCAATPAP
jgi:5'-nucleotidase